MGGRVQKKRVPGAYKACLFFFISLFFTASFNVVWADPPAGILAIPSKICEGDSVKIGVFNLPAGKNELRFQFISGTDTIRLTRSVTAVAGGTTLAAFSSVEMYFTGSNIPVKLVYYKNSVTGEEQNINLQTFLKVVPGIKITKQPDNAYVCHGSSVTFTFKDNQNGTNQWQYLPPKGSVWLNVGTPGTSDSYTITTVNKKTDDRNRYRAVISFDGVCLDTTNMAILTIDTIKPLITCPGDVYHTIDPDKCETLYTLPVASYYDSCGVNSITPYRSDFKAKTDPYPVGKTTIRYDAIDKSDNINSCTFDVYILNNETPRITCPKDTLIYSKIDRCEARLPNYSVIADFNCREPLQAFPDKTNLPPGKNRVSYRAFEGNQVIATCSFQVEVRDTFKRFPVVPADITENAEPEKCTKKITYTSPFFTTCQSLRDSMKQIAGLPPGSDFPIGLTRNIFEYRLPDGTQQQVSFLVTILDVEKPVVNCPAPATFILPKGTCSGYLPISTISAKDICGPVTVINNRTGTNDASGVYPAGLTNLTWLITDQVGNLTRCEQPITVLSPPLAVDDVEMTNSGQPLNISPLLNDSDCDLAGTLQLSLLAGKGPYNGKITPGAPGQLTYIPNPGFYGKDSLQYYITDNHGLKDTATIRIQVRLDNQPPRARDLEFSTRQDEPLPATISLTGTDPENDPLKLNLIPGGTTFGKILFTTDTSFIYTPPPGFTGQDTFRYRICDTWQCDSARLVISVVKITATPPPVAKGDLLPVLAGSTYSTDVTVNDFHPAGLAFAAPVTILTPPARGTASVAAGGTVGYRSPASSGKDRFSYRICDNKDSCAAENVYVRVLTKNFSGNNPPVAFPDLLLLNPNQPKTYLRVLENDLDFDGQSQLTLTRLASSPAGGNANLENQQEISYTPSPGFTGVDSFLYVVCDGAACDTGLVKIRITGYSAPMLTDDVFWLGQDQPFSGDVTANDIGITGSPARMLKAPSAGRATLSAGGNLTYTPSPGFAGIDHLVYEICDTQNPPVCSAATVFLVVLPQKQGPVAQRDTFIVTERTIFTGLVSGNDMDFNGGSLSWTALPGNLPQNGKLTLRPDGSFDYAPQHGFLGFDRFQYRVCDQLSLCDTTEVVLQVVKDTDRDGVPDYIDLDDDNDGIPDTVEGETDDPDNDRLPNSLDIDADGDGIPDNIEAQEEGTFISPSRTDREQDGFDDNYQAVFGAPGWQPADTDGDGIPDFLDPDSDEDYVPDATEGMDGDHNGKPDISPSGKDSDSDGLDDAFDTVVLGSPAWNATGHRAPLPDTDNDGLRDWRDTDDDGDGLLTATDEDVNGNQDPTDDDTDEDKIPNYLDPLEQCQLLIPNGFSPNGDGIADRFFIRCIAHYPNAALQIFNRYGQLLYQQEHYGNRQVWGDDQAFWDGKPNRGINPFGSVLPPGTYFYLLNLGDGSKPRTGSVYLNTNLDTIRNR